MLYLLFILVVSSFVNEGITNLLTKSDFFSFLRNFFDKRSSINRLYEFFSDLLLCGYCTSVWIAFFVSLFLIVFNNNLLLFDNKIFSLFFTWIFIHRFSNVIHFCIDFIDNARRCCDG